MATMTSTASHLPATAPATSGDAATTRLPTSMVYGIVLLSIAPGILVLFGADFSTLDKQIPQSIGQMSLGVQRDMAHVFMRGAFTHTILQWTAFCTAAFTAILSFIHFTIKRDVSTPVIGVALLCAGSIDAFHTLAADRLLTAIADNASLIPFTWAISRLFNALIIIVGAGMFLSRATASYKGDVRFVWLTGAIFALLAYNIITICATSSTLPQMMYPGEIVKRPWDMLPLLLYLFAAIFVLPRFYLRNPTVFSHALLVSVIPHIVTQLHVTFGSTQLYDNQFNIAHFTKILAYMVPFAGLVLDYVVSTRMEEKRIKELKSIRNKLLQRTTQLEERNKELQNFVRVASHDLKEPLRKITVFSGRLEDRCKENLTERDQHYLTRMAQSAERMQALIDNLLIYSQVTMDAQTFTETRLNSVINDVLADLELAIKESAIDIRVGPLPSIMCDPVQMRQLFQNLIDNAIKFRQRDQESKIRIYLEDGSEKTAYGTELCHITVEDNGIGFDSQYTEQIFGMFKRLPQSEEEEIEGTGMGLALCRNIVKRHHGTIYAQSHVGVGCRVRITLPKTQREEA